MSLRSVLNLNKCLPQIVSSILRPGSFGHNAGVVYFSTTSAANVKEIVKTEVNGKLVIEAVIKPSERAELLVKPPEEVHGEACPLCRLNLDVKHTDVLILSQFVRSDGCVLPRRITGLCKNQQKRVSKLVAMAQKAGLMPNLTPAYSHKDPKKRYGWKKFNAYYDETTIKY